jgi:hypothetical protein
MAPHARYALLFIGACVAVGGALAAVALSSDGSLLSRLVPREGPSQRIVLSEHVGPLAPTPTPTATEADTVKEADEDKAEATPTPTPEPALRVRPGSVFRGDGRGSLACRIPGGSDFLIEWDAAQGAAVAHFSGVKIPGALIRERGASNTLDSRVAISREEEGHRLSLTIDDSGTLRASVDGQDSTGTCNPA